MTSNVFLYLSVFCYLQSAQGLFELPLDISAATEVLGRVTDQIVAGNDSKLQEFAEIYDYFLNLTQLESEARKEVNRLTTSKYTTDDRDDVWQTAINDALNEENTTIGLNKTLKEEVIEYIETFAKKPENLKLAYLHSSADTRKDIEDEDTVETEDEEEAYNPFWDITLTRRIYKGKRVKINLFPFMASIHVFNVFACAGSIIKSDLVITAASCLQLAHNNRFFRENPAFLSVRVGSPFFSIGGDVVPVIEVYFHNTYDPRTLRNNLAIMRLRKLLSFRHRKVKKIDFDRNAAALPEDTPGIAIVGWGSKEEGNKINPQMRLHAAELDIFDTESCKEIYGRNYVTRTNFCAGYITKGDGACNRDVGDPGVSGKYLMGVTSFGSQKCGQKNTPTVFTKLGYYVDWIEEIMELEVPRIRKFTTTKRPFYLINKPVKLYGGEDELAPIPLLREQQAENEPTTVDNDEPDVQDLRTPRNEVTETLQINEIDPDIEQDPDIPPAKETLRLHPPAIIETGNVLDYDENNEEEVPMKPVEHVTSIANFETTKQDSDLDVENIGRTLQSPEISGQLDIDHSGMDDDTNNGENPYIHDHRDIADSTNRPATGMGNVEPEEITLDFNSNMVDNTNNLATTSNPDVWVDTEDYSALRKIHRMPHVENQTEKKNSESVSHANIKPDELENTHINENINRSFDKPEIEESQIQSKFQEEITDDMVKREIQNLIAQLETSDELPVAEERRQANGSLLENLVDNAAKYDAKTPEAVLTFLYLTDSEKPHLRTSLDKSEEEGLSIDPAPFQRSMNLKRSNSIDLIGKSEIYEIFANVMNTVANKTTG